MIVLLLACGGPTDDGQEPTDASSPPHSSVSPTGDTGTTGSTSGAHSALPGHTAEVPECTEPFAPGIGVAATASPHPSLTLAQALSVTVDQAAAVAVGCTSASDEPHLFEATTPATSHEVHAMGLLPDTAYECTVVPTCPPSDTSATVSFTTGGMPVGVHTTTVTSTSPGHPFYTLTNVRANGGTGDIQRLVMYDGDGRLRWYYPLGSGLDIGVAASHVTSPARGVLFGGGGSPTSGAPAVLDLWDGPVWTETFPGSETSVWDHEVRRLRDGRILTIELVDNRTNLLWTGFQLRIFHPKTGRTDWSWNSQSAVDAGTLPPARNAGDHDPYHANWAEVVNGSVYVSLCNLERILKIDQATGAVVWSFGAGGDFTGTDFPECAHGIEVEGDHLLVYDNGRERMQSAASEYVLDEVAMTSTRVWTWTEPLWFEWALGDVDRTADGTVIVTQGHPERWSTTTDADATSSVVEVDPATDAVVWRMTFDDENDAIYRSDRVDGCDIFGSTRACPRIAERYAELFPPAP